MIGQAIQGKHCEQMQLAVCTAECQNGRLYPFLSPPDGLIHFFHRVFHGKCEKKPGFPTMFSTFSTEFSTFSEGHIYTRCIFRRGGSRFFRQERAFPPFFRKKVEAPDLLFYTAPFDSLPRFSRLESGAVKFSTSRSLKNPPVENRGKTPVFHKTKRPSPPADRGREDRDLIYIILRNTSCAIWK